MEGVVMGVSPDVQSGRKSRVGVSLWPALPLHLALVGLWHQWRASGTADFALAAIRADTPHCRPSRFAAIAFTWYAPSSTRCAAQKAAGRGRPGGLPFIHLARHSSVRQYLEAAFRPQAMRTLMEVEQLATVTGMVRGPGHQRGASAHVVPLSAARRGHRPLQLPGLQRQILPGAASRPEPVDRGAVAV